MSLRTRKHLFYLYFFVQFWKKTMKRLLQRNERHLSQLLQTPESVLKGFK